MANMNFKKISALVMSCALAGAVFAGCGSSEKTEQDGFVKTGMIATMNASEQKMDEILGNISKTIGFKAQEHKFTFYPSLSSMEMGIEAGQVQEISTYQCVADYIIKKNPKFEIVNTHDYKLSDNFACALRAKDEKLKEELSSAIESMKTDGTIERFVKEYINSGKPADELPPIEPERFEGAETLKIAVTGDLPPLDLIRADGKPAGFNTAMLAELGKRLHKNIKIIQIESGSRATALISGEADVSFWAIIPVGTEVPADIDAPKDLTLTIPYFKDRIVHLKLNK